MGRRIFVLDVISNLLVVTIAYVESLESAPGLYHYLSSLRYSPRINCTAIPALPITTPCLNHLNSATIGNSTVSPYFTR